MLLLVEVVALAVVAAGVGLYAVALHNMRWLRDR